MRPRDAIVTLAHIALLGAALLLFLGCGFSGMLLGSGPGWAASTTNDTPSWACPSPTPKPYGEAGPVKEWVEGRVKPTRAPSGPIEREDDTPLYFVEWEQEYPDAAGPPFPSPTPYVIQGSSYSLGQRVYIPPLVAQVSARSGERTRDGRQLHLVEIVWLNPTATELPLDVATQLTVSAIHNSQGREVLGNWRTSVTALDLAGITTLPTAIPPGESQVIVPIIAGAGTVKRVDLTLVRGVVPAAIVTTTPGVVPTATPMTTPTPNTELRAVEAQTLIVSFSDARPLDPPCDSPGAITAWETTGSGAWGEPDVGMAAPPGADRAVLPAL